MSLDKLITKCEELQEKANPKPLDDTDEGPICKVCDNFVKVRDNAEWEDDPICDICLGEFARECRINIPKLIACLKIAQATLDAIEKEVRGSFLIQDTRKRMDAIAAEKKTV